MPKVSICIPSRNTREYLEERRESIQLQTFSDYEVIIVDDESTDGSKEFFRDWGASDSRVQLHDGPGKGLYPGWNFAIQLARSKYVYVATSDDTMAPNFLEVMVRNLEKHPNCGMAVSPLVILPGKEPLETWWNSWWESSSALARSIGPTSDIPHLRMAPGDGLLHVTGESVFVSVTQILFRRDIFDKVGLYPTEYGFAGDFAWSITAGLCINSVFDPGTWAGWRVHSDQATAKDGITQGRRRAINREIFSKVISPHLTDPVISNELKKLHRVISNIEKIEELKKFRANPKSFTFAKFSNLISDDPLGLTFQVLKRYFRKTKHFQPILDSVIEQLRKDLDWVVITK